MAFNVVAFQESIDPGGAYVNITAVADPVTTTTGDIIYVPPATPYLFGAQAFLDATTAITAYLQSPSLRRVANYDIAPVVGALYPSASDIVALRPSSPIKLDENEGLEALINSNPSSAAVQSVVALLSDGAITSVDGEIFSVYFTTAITETVGAWTNGEITFAQTLPIGDYQLVGAAMFGTSGVAFRFNGVGKAERPGFLCNNAMTDRQHPLQRKGGLGVWLEFNSMTPPSIDWLAHATSGTSQTGIMDLIRL